ncbi:MAG: pyridine nucleotide-disulfide oxidoreductase/dicluster-binding protein [Dissulfurispiraceae bacterium]
MDHDHAREREMQCIQEWPPECTATCPVHVDARGMIAAILKGDYAAAFAIFHKAVPFPGIISRICDHPCQVACKRIEVGEAIMINALEKACTDYSERHARKKSFVSKKDKRVAVIGAGLSGLTAAFDLASKGYLVEIFEAKERIGGRVRDSDERILSKQAIDDDLSVLEVVGVTIHCNSQVSNNRGIPFGSILEGFDAIYLGPGQVAIESLRLDLALNPDGHIEIAPITYATSDNKVFSGGSHRYSPSRYSPISSMSDGRLAAVSIDRFMQGASLTAGRDLEGSYKTKLYTSTKGIEPLHGVPMADRTKGYTQEEAAEEAQRCLNCQCLECVKVCEYLAHYGSYPKRYVREIYNNDSIIMGMHQSNRMVNTCALCSLCEAVCPVYLNMADICLDARQSMVKKGKMPPSAHDFALRDMAFSNSEAFSLSRHQPGFSTSKSIFYPGCQLSASSPGQVAKVYDYLRQNISGGVGLMLGCCGAPAQWAGEKDLLEKTMGAFAKEWRQMGSPRIITACSSCYRVFKDFLKDAEAETLWSILAVHQLPQSEQKTMSKDLAVHDTCSTRYDESVQDNIRCILGKLGVQVTELNDNRNLTTCCSYGGLMSFANSEVAEKVVRRRIGESDIDYVTYCAMCRDNFSARGKRALHILDLIWAPDESDPAARKGPGFSDRHENRAKLKAQLLREVWEEKVADEKKALELYIDPEVAALMETRMILVEDLQKVISHAENTGEKILDAATGHLIAHYKPVSVTYWVEYSMHGSGFIVHHTYSHRMELTEATTK